MAAMAAPHCASSSSAFLGLPRSDGGRRYGNSCRFAANARLATVSATLDKETAAAKPRRSRRPRKATKSGSTALLAPDEPAEAKNGGATEAQNGGLGGRGMVALDDVIVNPVGLGRRSRQVFDEVWRKFSRLGQMSSASSAAVAEQDPAVLFRGGPMCDFTVPGAQDTTVLVVGATSRIGRIVVRKLMLRGYNVKVLLFSSPNWLIFRHTISMAFITDPMTIGEPSSFPWFSCEIFMF
jgi:E1A/CREB-binding protein